MQATGLIAVWLHVPPHREEEFHAWYELEHIPQVVGLEGFVSGRRYYCDLHGFELGALAQSVGMDYIAVRGLDGLERVLRDAAGRDAPAVLV